MLEVLCRLGHLAVGKQHRHLFQHRQQAGTLDFDGSLARRPRHHGRPVAVVGRTATGCHGGCRLGLRLGGCRGRLCRRLRRRIGYRHTLTHHFRFDFIDLSGGEFSNFTGTQPIGSLRCRSGFALVPVFFPAEQRRKESHGRMPPDWPSIFSVAPGDFSATWSTPRQSADSIQPAEALPDQAPNHRRATHERLSSPSGGNKKGACAPFSVRDAPQRTSRWFFCDRPGIRMPTGLPGGASDGRHVRLVMPSVLQPACRPPGPDRPDMPPFLSGHAHVDSAQSPYSFWRSSRRCWASSDSVAVGRASRRGMPMGSPVSSQ